MKKRILSLFMAISLVLAMIPAIAITALAEDCEHLNGWTNGECNDCGEECEHDWVSDGPLTHSCDICDLEEIEHEWEDGVCKVCEYECEHDWESDEDSKTGTHTCSNCRLTKAHTWDGGTAKTGVICGGTDDVVYVCTADGCDGTYTDESVEVPHDFTSSKDATTTHHICSRVGCTGGPATALHEFDSEGLCEICGYQCEHDWQSDGDETHSCNLCDMIKDHEWENDEVKHTCSICSMEDDHKWDEGVCKVCEYECLHDWVSDGALTHSCDICDLEEINHEWEDGVCTVCEYECEHDWVSDDEDTHSCSICDLKELPHDWESDGNEKDDTHTCSICELTEAHTWDGGAVEDGVICGEKADVLYTCDGCGEEYTDANAVVPHIFTSSTDATATHHQCTRPGCGSDGDDGPATEEHEFDSEGLCEICGYQCLHESWGEWEVTKPATSTTAGEKTRACEVCGVTETESIPATGSGGDGGGGGTPPTPPPETTEPPPQDPELPKADIVPTEPTEEEIEEVDEAVANLIEDAADRWGGVVEQVGPPIVVTLPKPEPTIVTLKDIPEEINVSDVTVMCKLNPDGTLTPVPTRIDKNGNIVVLLADDAILVPMAVHAHFSDLGRVVSHVKDEIERAASLMVVEGFPNGTFHPGEAVTAQQAVTMFLRATGIPVDWATAMATGVESGFIGTGMTANGPMTRTQAAALIVNALKHFGLDFKLDKEEVDEYLKPFTDMVGQSEADRLTMAICVKLNIFRGSSANHMKPTGILNRSQMASLAVRLQDELLDFN